VTTDRAIHDVSDGVPFRLGRDLVESEQQERTRRSLERRLLCSVSVALGAMIFSLPLDQVDADRREALRTDGVRESRHLEYKEALPGTGEDDRKEFLADVTSFANAAGGDLIYGVRGRRDSTGKSTGEIEAIVRLPDLNVGDVQLRFENMIRDGVAPRMSPVTFHPIARGTAPPCLLLRIPRGWAGLHMIIYKNWSRFYARNSAGKYQLDVNEIRAAFLAAETAYDRIRRLRTERVARALALETPVVVGDGSKLILHAFPAMHPRKSGRA
jgi:hypothetical protein